MKKTIIISALLTLFAFATVKAQTLHKDIEVEQAVTPDKRDASRIAVLPTVRLSPVKAVTLPYSSRVVSTRVPATFSVLDPVAWGDRLNSARYRGYLDLAAGMPLGLGDVSAGYRLYESDKTRLNLWGQYNGDVYRRDEIVWHDHTATIALDLTQRIGSASILDAKADYTYGFHDMPNADFTRFSQRTSRMNAEVGYKSSYLGLTYGGGVSFQHFGFSNAHFANNEVQQPLRPSVDPISQNLIGINLNGELEMGSHSGVGLDIDASFLHTGTHYAASIPFFTWSIGAMPARTTSLLALNPYFATRSGSVTFRIGADVDIVGKGGKALRVAPDVRFGWHGMQMMGFELRAHGGTYLNSLASLYDITPYINSTVAYGTSHAPLIVDGKLSFGPFFGGTVELFGGYGRANDWLMPAGNEVYPAGAVWESVKLRGYHYGVRLGYDNGKTLKTSLSYEGAPSKRDRAWMEWRDRAKHVVNASATIRPVKPLEVTVGYELRAQRAAYGYSDVAGAGIITSDYIIYPEKRVGLGTISNLSAGVSYAINDALTVFARGENLLGRKYLYIGSRPSASARGMIGAAIKF